MKKILFSFSCEGIFRPRLFPGLIRRSLLSVFPTAVLSSREKRREGENHSTSAIGLLFLLFFHWGPCLPVVRSQSPYPVGSILFVEINMAEIDYRSCFGAGDDALVHKRMLSVPKVDTLDDLIRELRVAFETDHVNIERVQDLMFAYKSNPREWIKFAHFDPYRYTRNLVDEGNGKYNLMLLAWAEGQGSSIHDHADSHCFMKVLDGSLKEVRFAWPPEEEKDAENAREMEKIGEAVLATNEVTYINDSIGLHRMENPSHSQTAVSLHLYCPPFESVLLFDQRTGHKTKGKVTFWSKYGHRTPFGVSSKKMNAEDYENN